MPSVINKPVWAQYENDLHSTNVDTAVKATEAFVQERDKELENSKRSREWEEDRKKELYDLKPQWVKKKRAAETAPLTQAINELKKGVSTSVGVKPMPGYVLVKPIVEKQTASGLYLPEELNLNTNTGKVLAVGDEDVNRVKVTPPPCKAGDTVMFKKGLPGLEMTVKGEFCLLMTWGDLLGVLGD